MRAPRRCWTSARAAGARAVQPGRAAPRLRRRGAGARLARSRAAAAAAGARGARACRYRAAELAGVAYTAGPGLIGALLTGAALARSLAYAWGVPAIGVHHLEGHLLAPLLEAEPPPFPHVALLVSGGHTLLMEVAARRRLPRARARRATMPPARPSTRRRSSSDCRTRAARSSRSSPSTAGPARSAFRARCSIGRASSSASRA